MDVSRIRFNSGALLILYTGSAGLNCDGCNNDRESSVTGILRIGGTVSPYVRLGVETTGWTKTQYGVKEYIGLVSGVIYYYPSISNDFWIKGGAGYSQASEANGIDRLEQDGAGITLGVGYDLPIAHSNFVIVPFAASLRQVSGTIEYNGSDTGVSSNADISQVGASVGFRH